MRPRVARILFDFDGVLAPYRHERRIAALAAWAGCSAATVREALLVSGLERDYDGGAIDTAGYLDRLGAGIGRPVDEATWIAARMAGSVAEGGGAGGRGPPGAPPGPVALSRARWCRSRWRRTRG